MYVSVINVLVLTATGVLGSNVKYPKLNLCPPNANCYNVILCPGAIEKFKKGTPPIICGWVRDIPKVCCTNTATQINNLLNATTEEPRSRSTDSFRLSSISETGCGKRYSLPPALTMGGGDNDSKWRWPWMLSICLIISYDSLS
ncbi:hypothetical protein CDAR_554751 [Caerostris darwini]|uniref:Uncharacterized protein n=1 Tax=Caerostris darwini TaxID=1538125 RepID=A0AAV4N4H5_9ARAC|nr:hypothetical protein CDAR_554751 [Caerostris darwini]